MSDGASTSGGAKDRMAERMKKLQGLHRLRNQSRQLNHAQVVEEDRRAKEPKNAEVRLVATLEVFFHYKQPYQQP